MELPIGATEDRVIGSLDLQRVLRDGEHAFTPGLLAEAHGGVLYVDEVNLLQDHLVDVLLDAAAMGRVHIEREGVSHSHEARFILVGTMNPEEGELRPQLLDRFGLTVDVRASRDVDERVEVIRQRMAFEDDPGKFARSYAEQDAALARRIATARAAVGDVVLPEDELRRIASLCAAFEVDGMRADLVVARAAVAHAAWRAADTVGEEDIRVAAQLALPHRRRRDPFDEPGLDPQLLDEALAQAADDPEPEPDPPGGGAPNPEGPQNDSSDASPARFSPAAQRSTGPAVPHSAAHGAGSGRRRAGPPVACPQPVRRRGARTHHRRFRYPSVRHGAGGRPPRRHTGTAARCSPTTSAAPSAKGARRTW